MRMTEDEYVTAMEYLVDLDGLNYNDQGKFAEVCIAMMSTPIENFLTPERGMAHLKEYSEPIATGQLYCGTC